ncbi:hypothetical protein [Bacillus sp. 03113]|uniref:hypothetical protein n=1 Tax=Bacillus sp. 03113 TaxID=2578211 RepID=UPI0015E8A190|nr:hypothetical protein [Bacillus sp. 03113]
MDFFVDLFWLLFNIVCVFLFGYLLYKQHVIKKDQDYLIKLNHEIIDKLKEIQRK